MANYATKMTLHDKHYIMLQSSTTSRRPVWPHQNWF